MDAVPSNRVPFLGCGAVNKPHAKKLQTSQKSDCSHNVRTLSAAHVVMIAVASSPWPLLSALMKVVMIYKELRAFFKACKCRAGRT
jgi:hypothetical protein